MNKIDRSLYEIFADKTLSEGCIINIEKNPIQAKWDGNIRYKWIESVIWHEDFEILWHEPQLHDVFRVAKSKKLTVSIQRYGTYQIFIAWPHVRMDKAVYEIYNPTLPLLQQSDETKSAIISLFS